MTETNVTGLVVAPAGRWRDGLCVLLKASQPTTTFQLVDDVPDSLMVLAAYAPRWVVVDVDLLNEPLRAMLQILIERPPGLRCLIITHTTAQAQQARSVVGAQALADSLSLTDLSIALSRVTQVDSPPI